MKNNYTLLKQLIDYFEEYEQDEKQTDLLDFSYWMISKLEDNPNSNKRASKKNETINLQDFPIPTNTNNKTSFLESISRIARYHDFYIRKALQELNINSRLEFLFLQSVNNLDKAKKTDLINIHLLEYTTGMDTISRLIKNGILYESQDVNDKRAKLLALTKEGISILKQAEKRINEENEMFFAAINKNKWKKALPVIEEIDSFHNFIYSKHNDKPFAEICNLMDSLKYLHK
jgi:DNA-binding MarR family transcriptional regulator